MGIGGWGETGRGGRQEGGADIVLCVPSLPLVH